MKKEWVKPELIVEEYELTQTVAKGCGTIIKPMDPNKSIVAGCGQVGNGHWSVECTYGELQQRADTNHDGKITWDEFSAFAGAARNGQKTGAGHAGHADSIFVGDEIIENPFNS